MRRNKWWTLIVILMVAGVWNHFGSEDQNTGVSQECNPLSVSHYVQAGYKIPTKTLFVFAQPDLVARSIQTGTISKDDWNQLAMGRGKFRYKFFRQGLRAAETLADASPKSRASTEIPMAIELKENCIQQSKVSSLIDLAAQSKFKKWFNRNEDGISYSEWKGRCFNQEGIPKSEEFQFYETPETEQKDCEKWVDQYWNDQQIALIYEHLFARTWVIRDPACIQSVKGNSEYWLSEFSKNDSYWLNACEQKQARHGLARIWFSALVDKASLGRNPASVSSDLFDQTIKRCQEKNKLQEFGASFQALARKKEGSSLLQVKEAWERLCQ